MANPRPTRTAAEIAKPFVLGRAAFERIGAVEGIEPSAASRARSQEFDDRGLSSDARRRAIIEAHRPNQD